ncbi:hypothetical protein ACFU99_38680, partial [Streptomyces sp. NPDC057654]|uniref:hypothetical protein n=1 Tax=Streptomyces sp. NPDC057654 TaxID=3346196 RepID=UPI0036AC9BC0
MVADAVVGMGSSPKSSVNFDLRGVCVICCAGVGSGVVVSGSSSLSACAHRARNPARMYGLSWLPRASDRPGPYSLRNSGSSSG